MTLKKSDKLKVWMSINCMLSPTQNYKNAYRNSLNEISFKLKLWTIWHEWNPWYTSLKILHFNLWVAVKELNLIRFDYLHRSYSWSSLKKENSVFIVYKIFGKIYDPYKLFIKCFYTCQISLLFEISQKSMILQFTILLKLTFGIMFM